MIDRDHPLLREVKQAYRDGKVAYEKVLGEINDKPKPDKQVIEDASQALDGSRTKILACITKFQVDSSVLPEDRERYIEKIEIDFAFIKQWIRDTSDFRSLINDVLRSQDGVGKRLKHEK